MSASLAGRRTTTIPSNNQDAELAATASRAIARANRDNLEIRLPDGTQLDLPASVTRMLSAILTEMANGNSVTLIPVHADLSTQEAANLLNVSRPFLIKLLETKLIPFSMVGTHRRVQFSDLIAYQDRFAAERENAQQELANQAQELDMGYAPLSLHSRN